MFHNFYKLLRDFRSLLMLKARNLKMFQNQFQLSLSKIQSHCLTSQHQHLRKHLEKPSNLLVSPSITTYSTQQHRHRRSRSFHTVTVEYERNHCAPSNRVEISLSPIFSHVKIFARKIRKSSTSSVSHVSGSATRIWISRSCECST